MSTLTSGISWAGFRRMFYAVTPNETSFGKVVDVPNYLDEAVPWFLAFIVLEIVYSEVKRQRLYRPNDALTSMSSGLFLQLTKLVLRAAEMVTYIFVWQRFRVYELPWNSRWTWFLCFLGYDLGYYWFHRAAHEVNIMWAMHQVHHSSEDYNLSTALRQSIFQQYTSFVFYLPMALIIPPSIFAVHVYFNLLYQFWIHTQVIRSLGPLEYIFNTPSHHRVHHGRNPYCIDKNYGGTLIVWDRLFGTFAQERDEEPVAYGLVHNIDSFDTFYVQFCVLKWILFEKIPAMNTFGDKIRAIFYGPGWDPGKPRTGLLSDIPEVEQKFEKYNPRHPPWISVYVLGHFIVTLLMYTQLNEIKQMLTVFQMVQYTSFLIFTLYCFGLIFENKWYAGVVELVRCSGFFAYLVIISQATPVNAARMVLLVGTGLSTIVWSAQLVASLTGLQLKQTKTN